MNATLQCLAHIPELSEDLINNYFTFYNNIIQAFLLTKEYIILLINIFSINNDSTSNNYRPNSLKNIIGSKDALFV